MLWHKSFDADAVIADLGRATILMGVPTFYVRLAAHPGLTREAAAGMRLFVSGSAPLLEATFADFEAQDRPPHPRTLRHDRGGDDLLQPL